MAWLAVDKDGAEYIYDGEPQYCDPIWLTGTDGQNMVRLPKGSIEKLIGKTMSWKDDTVEI